VSQQCLAVIYDKLGRHADAEAELAKLKAALGDTAAYQYATIYAQWGNRAKALEWLETALRLRDPGLESEDRPAPGPLRNEPRFQAIERELKFPIKRLKRPLPGWPTAAMRFLCTAADLFQQRMTVRQLVCIPGRETMPDRFFANLVFRHWRNDFVMHEQAVDV
jgi:tetratricopeptide (TPR) repeat protein